MTKNQKAKTRLTRFLKRGVAVLDYYGSKGFDVSQKKARFEVQISKVSSGQIVVMFPIKKRLC